MRKTLYKSTQTLFFVMLIVATWVATILRFPSSVVAGQAGQPSTQAPKTTGAVINRQQTPQQPPKTTDRQQPPPQPGPPPVVVILPMPTFDPFPPMPVSTPNPAKVLDKEGPRFPDGYSMSSFSVQGFVKGNWPMVVDYESSPQSITLLTIVADGVEPVFYRLQGGARQEVRLTIPGRFGDRPQIALYTVRALSTNVGEVGPVYFRIYGLGAGPRAVGSVGIDRLSFRPGTIRPSQRGEAVYSFHVRNDFDKVRVEFYKVGRVNDQVLAKKVGTGKTWEQLRRDRTEGDRWDGKTDKDKPTQGQHQFCARAWMKSSNDKDWVIACSGELVRVE